MQKIPITEKPSNILLNTVPSHDKEMIKSYINLYANPDYSFSVTRDIDLILEPWACAKSKYLAKVFNGSLILHKTIDNFIDMSKKLMEIDHALDTNPFMLKLKYEVRKNFYFDSNCFKFDWKLDNYYPFDNYDYQFYNHETEQIMYYEDYSALYYYLFSNRFIYEGHYRGPSVTITYVNEPDTKIIIHRNTKINKVYRMLAKCFDIPEVAFEDFRILCSTFTQQKAESLELTLSIHPLDYMTMSDNSNHWDSCMSWKENGCYRQGTVEMMNSPCVVVGYIRSQNTDYEFEGGKWNSKTWRQLFIVEPHVIASIMSYPYGNDDITKLFMEWLKELAAQAGMTYEPKLYSAIDRFDFVEQVSQDGIAIDQYFDFGTGYMYNDFWRDTHYFYVSKKQFSESPIKHLMYSGASECMCCGEWDIDIPHEEMLVCQGCRPCYLCDECGELIGDSEGVYMDNLDIEVCPRCYREYYFLCLKCDEYHALEDGYYDHIITWQKSLNNEIIIRDLFLDHICLECGEGLSELEETHFEIPIEDNRLANVWAVEYDKAYPIVRYSCCGTNVTYSGADYTVIDDDSIC